MCVTTVTHEPCNSKHIKRGWQQFHSIFLPWQDLVERRQYGEMSVAKRIKRRSETMKRVGRNIHAVRRGSPRDMGYDADWERIAKRRRELDHYLCQA